jgi:hypothetical protein
MTEQPAEHDINEFINPLKAAVAGAKANGGGPADTSVPVTLIQLSFLLNILDNSNLIATACEAAGQEDGWDKAVNTTADHLSPNAEGYRRAMLAANPYRTQAAMMMDLAVHPVRGSN